MPMPAGARVIDLGDATLLPGLIDAHTHLTGESSDNWLAGHGRPAAPDRGRDGHPGHRLRRADADGRLHHRARRRLGGVHRRRPAQRHPRRHGRRARACWSPSTPSAPAAATATRPAIPTAASATSRASRTGIASGADQFRDAVRFQVKYGADVIKVCATGGVLSLADEVDTPQLTQDEMNAIVDEAHRLRKKVAAHAHGAEGAKVAIRAGVDSIEHGSFLDDEAWRMMKQQRHVSGPHPAGRRVRARAARAAPVPAGDRGQGARPRSPPARTCSAGPSRSA